jgi:hypothetical protein
VIGKQLAFGRHAVARPRIGGLSGEKHAAQKFFGKNGSWKPVNFLAGKDSRLPQNAG